MSSAGHFMPRASCGRSALNSRTKESKRSCCCRPLKPGGGVSLQAPGSESSKLTAADAIKVLQSEAQKISNGIALRAANKAINALGDWLDACHNYRHEDGVEEPSQPPIDLAVSVAIPPARCQADFKTAAVIDCALRRALRSFAEPRLMLRGFQRKFLRNIRSAAWLFAVRSET